MPAEQTKVTTGRRRFMKTVGGSSLLLAGSHPASLLAATPDPWDQAQAIIDRFAQPLGFRKEEFVVTAFGAPIPKDDILTIVDYLSRNYGTK